MKLSDAKKFDKIRNRIRDFVRHHPEAVENGTFVRVTGHVMGEAAWLVDEIERLVGQAAGRPPAEPAGDQ